MLKPLHQSFSLLSLRVLRGYLAFLFVFHSASNAGVIEGSRQVGVDKSAVLRVPIDKAGESYSWQVAGDVSWLPGENKTETFVILLDLPAGPHVVSFVSYDRQLHEVAVIHAGDAPNPSPTPTPPAPPDPSPIDRFGLARDAAAWATEVPLQYRPAGKRLSGSFRAIASAIAAGSLKQPSTILAETRESNNRALATPEAIDAWKPFGQRLEARLAELHQKKQLTTADDYRQAWIEIAEGLK